MVLSIMQKRRSIRKYLNKPVEQEKIDLLIEAALRAPSSRGRNPWEFIVVTDKSLLEKLSKAKPHGASFLKDTPLGIVVCSDMSISDMWIEDTSIASAHILLAAESLGLGACWIQMRARSYDENTGSEEYIRNILNIPESHGILSIIAAGYSNETMPGHKKEDLKYNGIHFDLYGQKGK